MISAKLRELFQLLEEAERRRADKDRILRAVDELDNEIDRMVMGLAPERITDERFSTAADALREISEKFKSFRESVISERYHVAKKQLSELQTTIRHTHRLLILVRAGAPVPFVFQVSSPQFAERALVTAPETMVYASPMATRIYNILVRKKEATIPELVEELGIDDRTRDEVNRAIEHLLSAGYIKIYLTPDNRMLLKPIR